MLLKRKTQLHVRRYYISKYGRSQGKDESYEKTSGVKASERNKNHHKVPASDLQKEFIIDPQVTKDRYISAGEGEKYKKRRHQVSNK